MVMKRVFGVFLTSLCSVMLLTVALSVRQALGAEPQGWSKTYGGTYWDSAYSIINTSDNGYALLGETNSFGAGDYDFYLVKTDGLGNLQWNQSYGGADDQEGFSVVQTIDGGYALAGDTHSYSSGGYDFYLVKTDGLGIMQWNKTYGGYGQDVAYSLVQTNDGGYVLAGWTESFGAGGGDCYLVKTDGSGNMQWSQTYGGIHAEYAQSVIQTGDSGYALAGWTTSSGDVFGDCYLVKTDSLGNMQWNKTYGGTAEDHAYSVVQTSDGGYALAGYTRSFGAGYYDAWLVKTDGSGNMQWNKTYGGYGQDVAYSVVQASDGGYALAGYTASFGAGSFDCYLVKTDGAGNMLWNQSYGGEDEDRAKDLVQTGDDGYALAAFTVSYGAGQADAWLIKTDADGVIPELPSNMILAAFMVAAALTVILTNKKQRMRLTQGS